LWKRGDVQAEGNNISLNRCYFFVDIDKVGNSLEREKTIPRGRFVEKCSMAVIPGNGRVETRISMRKFEYLKKISMARLAKIPRQRTIFCRFRQVFRCSIIPKT